ncbi:hypothetical protein V8F20_011554 [Naviculisporaceae sp. PSN 640]
MSKNLRQRSPPERSGGRAKQNCQERKRGLAYRIPRSVAEGRITLYLEITSGNGFNAVNRPFIKSLISKNLEKKKSKRRKKKKNNNLSNDSTIYIIILLGYYEGYSSIYPYLGGGGRGGRTRNSSGDDFDEFGSSSEDNSDLNNN